MNRVLLVRHSQPDIASDCCYGQLDMPAKPEQLKQATVRLQKLLAEYSVSEVCASPLLRCRQLAEGLYDSEDIEYQGSLKEVNFGQWEGSKWDDIPRHQLDAWADNLEGYRLGQTGETVAEFSQRVLGFWQTRLTTYGETNTTQVWFTHAGVIRTIVGEIQALPVVESSQIPLTFGSLTCITFTTNGAVIEYLNR
ncbi:histidine phosphatase family protein [Agarivorans sp. Alg241-V36]|uniref:histidine phosphatase family protein n=1 Tax=Agarivorans sp. Alg241-V36 TaxID=2305992 RepID=UPI0013D3084E|nr:histidine phosphatase family protein [Agarivorans sp. Alg241-V36]